MILTVTYDHNMDFCGFLHPIHLTILFPKAKKNILDSAYKQVLSIHYVVLLEGNQSLLQFSSILSTLSLGRTTLLTEKMFQSSLKLVPSFCYYSSLALFPFSFPFSMFPLGQME